MASSGSGYDLSASTFSPDGRIFQVEYASKAVENAGTVIGIKCCGKNGGSGGGGGGVVLGVSKPLLHKMVVASTCSYKRIHNIDTRAGIASTGFLPDARVLVSRAIDEAKDYHEMYGDVIPPRVLADRLGSYVHYFTLHGALRPFGAAAVLAAYDPNAAATDDDNNKSCGLYMVEPNGAAFSYYGVATGKGKQAAKTELEKLQLHKQGEAGSTSGITTDEAVKHIAKILTLLHAENKDNEGKKLEIELSWICEASNWKHVGVPKTIIASAMAWAKEQLEADDDEDDDDDVEEVIMEE
jgi:20S proteasome subunit alpha 7